MRPSVRRLSVLPLSALCRSLLCLSLLRMSLLRPTVRPLSVLRMPVLPLTARRLGGLPLSVPRAAVLAALWLGAPAGAQTATLLADSLELRHRAVLVASGDVEVLYRDSRLRAQRIVYDRDTDSLSIDGPITLTDGDGVLVLADEASLDADLQNGILRSARLVLDRQLQLAADEIRREGGRFIVLDNSVASSCEVCANRPVPTWEIRAARVIHDRAAQKITFEKAQFRLLGVPVLYLPRLRVPDPSVERATGFLLPRVRSTSALGPGLRLPYFIALGPSADLTLTPYLSPRTRTLGGVYRQALARGDLTLEGALTDDTLGARGPGDLTEEDVRFYLFGRGDVALPRDLRLRFDVQTVSDPSYLLDYGYADIDRLESRIDLSRYRRNEAFSASLTDFRTLRDTEIPFRAQLPRNYGVLRYERRVPWRGGEVRLGADATTLTRSSDAIGPGRDVDRLGASAFYTRGAVLAAGIAGRLDLGATADAYAVTQDRAFGTSPTRIVPHAAVELRWPLVRREHQGARQVLEPVVHVAWSDVLGDAVPNEDSGLTAFDEGNLTAFSRFPGDDAVEDGLRTALALNWARYDPDGWRMGATVGRILRADGADAFAAGTGLDGTRSDWLAAGQIHLGDRLGLTARGLFDDGFDATSAEARLVYADERATLASTYLFLTPLPAENRPGTTHELTIDGTYRLTRHWTGNAEGRFDLEDNSTAEAGLGLEYRSECIRAAVSVSRRFTSSDSLVPTTDVGLEVSLAGLGGVAADASYRRGCGR